MISDVVLDTVRRAVAVAMTIFVLVRILVVSVVPRTEEAAAAAATAAATATVFHPAPAVIYQRLLLPVVVLNSLTVFLLYPEFLDHAVAIAVAVVVAMMRPIIDPAMKYPLMTTSLSLKLHPTTPNMAHIRC